MKETYSSMDQLPIMLNADQLAQVLGISRAGAYQLMHAKGFPTVKIGKRMIVPKQELIAWLGDRLKDNDSGDLT